MTTQTAATVTAWLTTNPAPVRHRDLTPWKRRVERELGGEALPALVELLAHGDLEMQYQAMAAARVLGASVEADGHDPNVVWLVRLPGQPEHRITPEHQLAG